MEVRNIVAGNLARRVASEAIQRHAFVGILHATVRTGNYSNIRRQRSRGTGSYIYRPAIQAGTGTVAYAVSVGAVGVERIAVGIG